jgi:hypothetical protein
MTSSFVDNWESMSVTERIDHLLADWKTCRTTRDVMVLQVAAAVSHHVLQQAGAEIKRLHSETLGNKRRIGEQDAIMAELWERIHALTAERDEARRMYCGRVSRDVPLDAFDIAKNHGWGCFPQEDEPCQ